MKLTMQYLLGFIAAVLVFLVANIPASYVLAKVALPKNIQVIGVSGTIWQAKIQQLMVDEQGIENINASLSPTSLLTFDPKLTITFGGALFSGPEGQFVVSNLLAEPLIQNASVKLAAQEIASKLQLPIAVSAKGQLQLTLATFSGWQQKRAICKQLDGKLSWPTAQVTAVEQPVNLGNLSAKLTCEKGAIRASVDANNNLGLSFDAYVRAGLRVSGHGFIKPGANFPAVLRDYLPLLGNADRTGRYRIRL